MKKINWRNTLFLTLTPLAAAISVPLYLSHHGFNWTVMVILAVFYTIFNMSITCGYHRYFSHRSYEAHPFLEFLYMFFGSGAFQGSVLEWCADHRVHHLRVDTEKDPYNIKQGFWYAHIGWLFFVNETPNEFPKDLTAKKMLVWQHKYYGFIATFVGFGLPWIVGELAGVGMGGLIFGGILRVVLTQHSGFMVNSVAHTFGTQPYSQKHTARDSFLLAVLTFGEGYHNYHHEFQADYRCAIKWYQYDPSKWTIQAFSWMGLVRKMKRVSPYDITITKVREESHRMTARGLFDERMAAMKHSIEEAQKHAKFKVNEYQHAYQEFKLNMQTQSRDRIRHMKAEMRLAQKEFKKSYKQWQTHMKALKKSRVYS